MAQGEISAIKGRTIPNKPRLANRSNFQNVANLRAGSIDRMRRQFEDARRFQRNLGDAKRPKMLFHVNNSSFFVEKDKVDRKEHSDRVHASGWNNPKPAAEFRPALGFSKQANKAAEVVIRYRRLGGHKGLPSLVIHVHISAVI